MRPQRRAALNVNLVTRAQRREETPVSSSTSRWRPLPESRRHRPRVPDRHARWAARTPPPGCVWRPDCCSRRRAARAVLADARGGRAAGTHHYWMPIWLRSSWAGQGARRPYHLYDQADAASFSRFQHQEKNRYQEALVLAHKVARASIFLPRSLHFGHPVNSLTGYT